MKKIVILILLFLPIFLLVTISFAAKVYKTYATIKVDSVMFVDENGEELVDEFMIEIDKGEIFQLYSQVIPELASDKTVSYKSYNENVCSIDSNGLITAVGRGTTSVEVKTKDGKKIDTCKVTVTDKRVSDVSIAKETVNMFVNQVVYLEATVSPSTAVNKNVIWRTSNDSIAKVDANGKVTALSVGTVIIYAIVNDEGKAFTDTCVINVVDGIPPISVDFSTANFIETLKSGYRTFNSTINLEDYIICGEGVDLLEVNIEIQNSDIAVIEGFNLRFVVKDDPIVLTIYLGTKDNPTYIIELVIIYS